MRLLLAALMMLSSSALMAAECPAFLDQDLRRLHSSDSVNLCDLAAGKPLLVVNTASHCGFTPQFRALEAVHQRYRDQGLVVVGFASDDFRQEADTEAEAATVCYKNFGVSFTMIAPTSVTGDEANRIFRHLNQQQGEPRWNFFKYVVSADGEVTAAFPSTVAPADEALQKAIAAVVASP